METVKYQLDKSRIAKAWYNLISDLPRPPAPPLHPGTGQPIGPDDLAPIFPMSLILQEVSQERGIEDRHAGARHLPTVAPHAAIPRPPLGENARHTGAHLL